MKAIISRPELTSLIGKIQTIVPTKPTIPILGNILIEVTNGSLIISATDLTVSMRVQMEANVIEEGMITLPARRFFHLIRELTISEIELSTSINEIAYIQAGSSQFRLNGIHKSEFPSLPDLSEATTFSITSEGLKEMFSKSVFAAAREDSRHVLNGVLMKVANSLATFIGTDGKRLARVTTSVDLDNSHKHDYLIPLKAVEEIVKSLNSDQPIKIMLNPDKIGIECDSMVLTTNLLSGEYPDVERVIPKENELNIILHREELMALLKQVALFTPDKSHSIHFILKSGELILTANSNEIGEGTASMAVNYSGEPFQIAFNPFFFHDILRHSNDETVSFSLSNPHDPGLITDSTSANYVIMPMRLNPN